MTHLLQIIAALDLLLAACSGYIAVLELASGVWGLAAVHIIAVFVLVMSSVIIYHVIPQIPLLNPNIPTS